MARARPTDWRRPDYTGVFEERRRRLESLRSAAAQWAELDPDDRGPNPWNQILAFYARNPVAWIEDWLVTYDPRNLNDGRPAFVPFVLFPKQIDLVEWLHARFKGRKAGLIEKSRDMGVSWVCLAYSLWLWEFEPGMKVSFGSRKEDLVDKIGDPDSLLEKIRMMVRMLPAELRPIGWSEKDHARYMKIINPENGAIITGEAGENIGRGGRSSIYFLDEAAFVDKAESVEAALSQNTDVRIDLSTPNPGNASCPFHRKRHAGHVQVFTFHWRDDPRKDDAWYEHKQLTLDPEILAAEVDIDYEARSEETAIPAKWIRSSQQLRRHLEKLRVLGDLGRGVGGLDVGAGTAKSVFVPRWGPLVGRPQAWTDADTMNTGGRADTLAAEARCTVVKFDAIGVGQGVAAGLARIKRAKAQAVNVGSGPTMASWPDGKLSRDKFTNLKAELWWVVRDRLRRTHEHWLFVSGSAVGSQHELSDLLLLPDDNDLASQLSMPRYSYTEGGKIQIERKSQMRGRGLSSPDYADALVLTFAPPPRRAVFGRTRGHW